MLDIITTIAPVNIAVLKYWGKRDEDKILPLNDSISATLDIGIMRAKTSVCASSTFTENKIWLNGKQEPFNNKRILNCLQEIKYRAKIENTVDNDFLSWNIHVCSENNFPTAAGLASSAAGYACLVAALSKLYKIKSDISSIARLGSGSACRSIYGGFVQWHAGVDLNGCDSYASQIVTSSHWPELRALILVCKESQKSVSSKDGMKNSVLSSDLLKYRVEYCVPKRVKAMTQAIKERDFNAFAELTMKDSNQFHAVCLDTYPPLFYMNEVSQKVIDFVHKFNKFYKKTIIAYTFDAGPNACLFMLKENVSEALAAIHKVFPSTTGDIVKGIFVEKIVPNPNFMKQFDLSNLQYDLINYIIHTQLGDGAMEVNDGDHLLDKSGLPINLLLK